MDHQIHAYTDEINPVSQLIEDEKKTTTYDVGNPGSGLIQAQKWWVLAG
jgi:hypothetical protein